MAGETRGIEKKTLLSENNVVAGNQLTTKVISRNGAGPERDSGTYCLGHCHCNDAGLCETTTVSRRTEEAKMDTMAYTSKCDVEDKDMMQRHTQAVNPCVPMGALVVAVGVTHVCTKSVGTTVTQQRFPGRVRQKTFRQM